MLTLDEFLTALRWHLSSRHVLPTMQKRAAEKLDGLFRPKEEAAQGTKQRARKAVP